MKVDIRVGTITEAKLFPEARVPAYQLSIDFGYLGIKKTSAQITTLYPDKDKLIGLQVLAVINMPKKQIATFMSECLLIGAVNGKDVVLLAPEFGVPNGVIVA